MAAGTADALSTVFGAEALRLAEILCARLCHDIAGPLSALTGSLELAGEADSELAEEATEMARATGRTLISRLKLLRAAWAGEGTALDLSSLTELAAGLPGRRLALDVSALSPDTVFDPEVGRVVLNLVLLAAEALPAGGTIWLGRAERDLLVGVSGARSAWPAGLGAALAGRVSFGSPREVQAPFTVVLARAAGLALSILMPAGPSAPEEAPPLVLGLARRGAAP